MSKIVSSAVRVSRRKPLAACVISIFALSAPAVAIAADTWTVNTCIDTDSSQGDMGTKSGSLRFAVFNAASGDTVDLSGLNCPGSKISLALGEIGIGNAVTGKDKLIIKGPTASTLTIDASNLTCSSYCDNRVFHHYAATSSGKLDVYNLRLVGGLDRHYSLEGLGGCIYSSADVTLHSVEVSSCDAYSQGQTAAGGGVYAKGNVTLKYSIVSGNTTTSINSTARGGGVRAAKGVGAKYSTIDGNSVTGHIIAMNEGSYKYALGGGISAGGNVALQRSTVSNNHSNGSAGGIDALGGFLDAPANSVGIYSSTISGNTSEKLVGGVYANAATVKLFNSTIAFNTAAVSRTGASFPFTYWGGGLALSGFATNMAVTMQSSLLSNNYTTGEFDFSTDFTSVNNITFDASSGNNLIRVRVLPTGTNGFPATLDGCPLLGPLRDNGGLTKTHALLSKSPAIDAGSNTKAYTEDQRGLSSDAGPPYPYPRASKVLPDIGAYEADQNEIVFNSNFEGCPILD